VHRAHQHFLAGPVSPSISTAPWPRAALAALASASRNGGAVPTIESKSSVAAIFSVSGISSSCGASRVVVLRSACISRSGATGLTR
jgi:hypothetical protein